MPRLSILAQRASRSRPHQGLAESPEASALLKIQYPGCYRSNKKGRRSAGGVGGPARAAHGPF
eukprot:4105329-Pyramimonas_sp.AAC.1